MLLFKPKACTDKELSCILVKGFALFLKKVPIIAVTESQLLWDEIISHIFPECIVIAFSVENKQKYQQKGVCSSRKSKQVSGAW